MLEVGILLWMQRFQTLFSSMTLINETAIF